MLYTQEHEEKYPAEASVWNDIDVPAKVRQCPTAGKTVANAYVYNTYINNLAVGDLDYPVETTAFADGQHTMTTSPTTTYDNVAYSKDDYAMRHNGLCIVGYADGHVEATKTPQVWLPVLIEGFEGDFAKSFTSSNSTTTVLSPLDHVNGSQCLICSWKASGEHYIYLNTPFLLAPVHYLSFMFKHISHSNPNNPEPINVSFMVKDINNQAIILRSLVKNAQKQSNWVKGSVDLDTLPYPTGSFQSSDWGPVTTVIKQTKTKGVALMGFYIECWGPMDVESHIDDVIVYSEKPRAMLFQ